MANMFRCTLASGGALILTVTTDSSYAGQTITCTDGTTTLTQICPSTSPYTVEFKIPNGGTWTISSGTTSTSVTIPDSAELHDIPNGSTITPTDDIQTWLHCSNIWDKAYTTISQVLADASTLQALIASNNAVDYMARSTTWASDVTANQSAMTYIGFNDYCANSLLANSTWLNAICNSTYFESVLNIKVPTMTSNTTPSGVASCSSVYDSNMAAYKAFSGLGSGNCWISANNHAANEWVQYQFTDAVCVRNITIQNQYYSNNYSTYCVKDFQILGSNDGTNFTTIYSGTIDSSKPQYTYIKGATNNNFYKYIRFKCVNNYGGNHIGVKAQYYGRKDA